VSSAVASRVRRIVAVTALAVAVAAIPAAAGQAAQTSKLVNPVQLAKKPTTKPQTPQAQTQTRSTRYDGCTPVYWYAGYWRTECWKQITSMLSPNTYYLVDQLRWQGGRWVVIGSYYL
jgi:hypothetical protein